MNGSDDCSQRHWRNAVPEQIYRSLSDDEGGIQGCIREAIVINPEIDCMMTEPDHYSEDRCKYSQTGWMSDGSQKAANGHAGIISSNESDHYTITETQECTCRRSGGKADGRDCLVSDSCEEMCHVSCSEPAVIEIPPRSCYRASCTAWGFRSPNINCVVGERLNAPNTPSNGNDDGISPTNEETPIELEENSNCSIDDGLQLSKSGKNYPCKICESKIVDAENWKIFSHSVCPNKYYHARCLTNKQLKSYGPFWYCPSCLCRICLMDQDDEKIVCLLDLLPNN
ncbi:PHD finger protein EHD3-like [Quercus suber]|uniref:PHD finger protein EHD3-like n=1 Tax=Quercus suber TaxID=58331 RepID=UPI0032DE87E5